MAYADVDKNLFGGLLPGGATSTKKFDKGQKADFTAEVLTPQEKADREAKKIAQQKAACEARGPGWRWNPNTNTCDRVPETPETQPETDTTNRTVDFKGDMVTVSQGGETFNFTREEYDNYLASQKGGGFTETPETKRLAEIAFEQSPQGQQQALLQQAAGQVGQLGVLTPAQEAKINFSQAITAGLARVIPSLAGGAAVGAVGGAAAGAGLGAIPGAILGAAAGAITGFTSGVLGNIKEQQTGELQAARLELTAARTNMRTLAMLASQDPANADKYVAAYNDQLTRIYQARRQTKAETQGDLNAFMEDGREQLAAFDTFLQPGGTADIYGQKLQLALTSGVPLQLDDFTDEELKQMLGEA